MRTLALSLLLVAASALADESQVRLKEGPGRDQVLANCVMCHSLDYITMNSPFLDKKGWEAEVTKMAKVMGAPVRPEDVETIQNYLAAEYGKK